MKSINQRTHTCGELSLSHVGQEVSLTGWVHSRRDHGGLIFVDLRDRYGITQIVMDPKHRSAYDAGQALRGEYVIGVIGQVAARPENMKNPKMATGEVELIVSEVSILSTAKVPPFPIDDEVEASELTRLSYRYLDLRRPSLQKNFRIRHQMNQIIRNVLDAEHFLEVETPILTKSTPEGARDYLVPSRVHPGQFFALPQSPQIFKQLLMISGFDRYFQIARCFRDEDLRADRQPEFTQLDLEMSFPTPILIQTLIEKLMVQIWKQILGIELKTPFQRMSYAQAEDQYASDKPDLRWNLPLVRLNDAVKGTGFNAFQNVLGQGGEIRGFKISYPGEMSRSQMDKLIEKAKHFGAKGVVWFKKTESAITSSVEKFLAKSEMEEISRLLDLASGDLGLVIADQPSITRAALTGLKHHLIDLLKIPAETAYAFLWVEHFPMFEFNPETQSYQAMHHPFTHPVDEDVPLVHSGDLANVRAQAYDLVLNGYEIGGGSIRIHEADLQQKIFQVLGLSQEQAERKFGFFLQALQYGTPPHGGIALGLDRLAMILCQADAIRDVIAFPKTQNAQDLMSDAPTYVDVHQLVELHIKSTAKPKGQ